DRRPDRLLLLLRAPCEPVWRRPRINKLVHSPRVEMNDGDLSRRAARYVRDRAVRTHKDLLGALGYVDGPIQFHCLQINDGHLVGAVERGQQPTAVWSRRRAK